MPNSEVYRLKKDQLHALAANRDHLRKEPELRWLFFEVTNTCNLFCAHCGSSCTAEGYRLSVADVQKTLRTIPDSIKPMICLTGGEPLTHPEFFSIAECVSGMGFDWGMTSNGTLIDRLATRKLRETGMGTVSISLDGMEKTHDKLRQKKGAWRKTIEGIRSLQDAGFFPQITTVVHAGNIDELEELYLFLCDLGITSWRPINVEPIGRACESERMLLTASQFDRLLNFIREKRYDLSCPMEVTYGCSHFLGIAMERMVRNNFFSAGPGSGWHLSGATVISVRAWTLRTFRLWFRAISARTASGKHGAKGLMLFAPTEQKKAGSAKAVKTDIFAGAIQHIHGIGQRTNHCYA